MTACLAVRLNAHPVSTGSRIRVAIVRLAQGRRKTRSGAPLGHQPQRVLQRGSARLIII